MANRSIGTAAAAVILLLGLCAGAAAQQAPLDTDDGGELTAVSVTATRIAQPSFDVPASIDTE
ncbi:MAG: hypothetical protein ACRET0_05545, partial [Steroidobacteraceae bacterium]